MDYVKAQGIASSQSIQSLYDDAEFEWCQIICNKGKHLVLRTGNIETKVVNKPGAVFGGAYFGEGPSTMFIVDGKQIDIIALGEKLVMKWLDFFSANGI